MSTIKNVLVAGANGNVAPTVIKHLLAANFNVVLLSRSAGPNAAFPHLKVLQSDYTLASLTQACKDQDAIVSTMSALVTMTQTTLVDAAIAAGVKRFIPSDFGLNTPNMAAVEEHVPLLYARLKPKKMVLEYLEEKVKLHPEFSWTAIGSGPYFDWTLKMGFLGTSVPNHTSTIIDSGNEPYITTTIPQIARAIVSVLQKPDDTANQYLLVTSFKTTQNEILAAAERATGEKFEVTKVEAEAWKQEAVALVQKGDFRGFGRIWGWFMWEDGNGHGTPANGIVVGNEILGLPQEDMVEVIREVAGLEKTHI